MNATEFRLTGHVSADGFVDWIAHRAGLLDLNGWVTRDGPNAITIVVAGPQPMVDAMEMACSLGPVSVDVERIESCVKVLAQQPDRFEHHSAK